MISYSSVVIATKPVVFDTVEGPHEDENSEGAGDDGDREKWAVRDHAHSDSG